MKFPFVWIIIFLCAAVSRSSQFFPFYLSHTRRDEEGAPCAHNKERYGNSKWPCLLGTPYKSLCPSDKKKSSHNATNPLRFTRQTLKYMIDNINLLLYTHIPFNTVFICLNNAIRFILHISENFVAKTIKTKKLF